MIKKTPIVVNDSRGFFTSRVFGTFCMEGVNMLAEGYSPLSIEQAALQAGMPIGPLGILDEVSLELTRKVRVQTEKDLAAEGKSLPFDAAAPLIEKMLNEFKRPGKKEGKGFYDYPEGGKKQIWQGLYDAFVKPEKAQPSEADFKEMQERILYRQAIESARCYEEGVLRNVPDANIGSIFGIGFAPWTGGVLQYINFIGLNEFVKRSNELAAKHGERFTPPKLLIDMAAKGETFV